MMIIAQIIIGVLVYRDAEQYGLNGLVWLLMVALLPNLGGAIIYLIIRHRKEKVLYCSHCHEEVKDGYKFCPQCRSGFGNICNTCGSVNKKDNKFCSHCGDEMTEQEYNIANKIGVEKGILISIVITISIIIGVSILIVAGNWGIRKVQINRVEKILQEQLNTVTGSSQALSPYNGYTEIGETINRKTGKERNILLPMNGQNTIQAQFNIKEGSAKMSIKKMDGQVIYENKYTDAQIETIPIEIKKDEQLEVTIIFDKCEGNYKVSFIE